MRSTLDVSERSACRSLGQPHSTERRTRRVRDDEVALTEAILVLAAGYGRYGHRRITTMLRTKGWRVDTDRVQRIWRRKRAKVPRRQQSSTRSGRWKS
ncbi:IS3 family transposase [Belnapia sp. T18]|uniref:IS3 family transposase n=1 Tax=Belnapia arida TaxID=2804533 RepID=A0ABS1U6D8_9PROT|nr:IS3 family transposase [Belnapia arida]